MPTEVPGFGPGAQSTALDAVAAGRGYSMALDRDGGVWVWGAIGAGSPGPAPAARRGPAVT